MSKDKEKNKKDDEKKFQEIGKIVSSGISDEMRKSYLEYAMSIIVSRALPDVRDGLKPVQRRILSVMHEDGLTHSARFKKSATVVGDTMSKYHPHGDSAIYETMARMSQDFSLRYPLVNGQGNWGSIDGDKAAAMRYTEAKMTKIAGEMLKDIEKSTVDYAPNYDGRLKEPKVLPATIPQLLLNGTIGIAVGMATNIPPHNLDEIVGATIHLIDNPGAGLDELMGFVKGPDFPTGGLIFGKKDIEQAYATGRGGILTRGEVEIIEKKEGKFQIYVSSIPYSVNKADLITKIADLVRDKKIDGIRDIRDESDKESLVAIAIDLKNGAHPQKVLNSLYKHTDLEKMYHFNMIALVDGIQPQVLSLKGILECFIDHRNIVVERRTKFDLDVALRRAHILEGLKKALDHINEIIKTIKSSADKDVAHKKLMKNFKLSDKQATAILEMRLQTLAGLERKKIEDELAEKKKLIKELKAILSDPKKILAIVKEELLRIKETYGDPRRTKVVKNAVGSFSLEDLIPNEDATLVLTRGGYIKRSTPDVYKVQKRGGKGVIDLATKEEDSVYILLHAKTHDDLLFFTDKGKAYKIKMYELPEGKRASKGKSIVNFLSIAPDERVTSALVMPKGVHEKKTSLVMITKKGVVKKVETSQFQEVRRGGIIAIRLQKDDELDWAHVVSSSDHLILASKQGQSVRFKEADIRSMGRTAAGVNGMRLKAGDELIGSGVVPSSAENKDMFFLTLSEKGFGKKTKIKEYRVQKRAGSGIKTAKLTSKTGSLVAAKVVGPDFEEIIAISRHGQILKTMLSEIPVLGRQTQGVKVMSMKAGDSIASLACL
ncbi:MAG: DNA gyrase subunit A [Candidatus Marinimicrobia bacterium]|nr:DNA gyrase subunit A [Candidatus Neomarinimicrobiota bacterium]